MGSVFACSFRFSLKPFCWTLMLTDEPYTPTLSSLSKISCGRVCEASLMSTRPLYRARGSLQLLLTRDKALWHAHPLLGLFLPLASSYTLCFHCVFPSCFTPMCYSCDVHIQKKTQRARPGWPSYFTQRWYDNQLISLSVAGISTFRHFPADIVTSSFVFEWKSVEHFM